MVPADDYEAVIGNVDDALFSIERLVRDQNASDTDRQRGRDHQNQYVQSVVDFFGADEDSSRYVEISTRRANSPSEV